MNGLTVKMLESEFDAAWRRQERAQEELDDCRTMTLSAEAQLDRAKNETRLLEEALAEARK